MYELETHLNDPFSQFIKIEDLLQISRSTKKI